MGYYLNHKDFPFIGKADALIRDFGAQEVPEPNALPTEEDKALVCVILNQLFDAAALCYNEEELLDFVADGTTRPRRWLVMDKATAHGLSGFDLPEGR